MDPIAVLGSDCPSVHAIGGPRHRRGPHRPRTSSRYCLSYTATLFTALPAALVPVVVTVRVLPSLDTADVWLVVTLPLFFEIVFTMFASTRVRATMSASGLFPVTGVSLPS